MGKDATCFTLVVWSGPSREARHRHHSAAQQPTAELHPRRDALEAEVQADPGLRNQTGRMGGATIGDEDLRSRGLRYGWDQNSLGIGPPLDAVSMDDLRQRFATGKKVQPQLASAHARVSIHVLGILNHAMGEHRPNRDSVTPNSLLRAIQLYSTHRTAASRDDRGSHW